MKRYIQIAVIALTVCGAVWWILSSAQDSVAARETITALPPADLANDVQTALRTPDKFNWAMLVEISKKAPPELQNTVTVGGQSKSTNNAVWETWADDDFTFPGRPDPANPPKWQDRNQTKKQLGPIIQQEFRRSRVRGKRAHLEVSTGGSQETRRNESAFQFIIDNRLFYTEGLKCAFSKGVDDKGHPNGKKIDFKTDAVEIKAVWKPIQETEKANFHWNYDKNGSLFGLTGLHIISKTLPNWTWATWEWVGNKGRCDYIGCFDSFGTTPSVILPDSNTGQQYPAGTFTPALLKMFQDAGFDQQWTSEWQNYRLKGSQVDFTTTDGIPTLVGNSIVESGFEQSSSCITCHSVASVDSNGVINPTFGFTNDNQSQNGPVQPGWFFDLSSWDPDKLSYATTYYQADFVWGFARARRIPAGKPVPPCTQ
jgi:hypothetical protein